jgi:hypothetical protein
MAPVKKAGGFCDPMRGLPPSALLLALLLASGCLASSPGAPPSAPSPLVSTSNGPASSAPQPPTAQAPPAGGSAPFAMDGQTALAACAFGPFVAQCRGVGGDGSLRRLEGAGPLLRLRANLTWSGPLAMQVALLHQVNGTWTYTLGDPVAQGSASPLAIDFSLLGRAGPLAVVVQQANPAILPVAYASVDTPQPFHAAGTLAWA